MNLFPPGKTHFLVGLKVIYQTIDKVARSAAASIPVCLLVASWLVMFRWPDAK